MSSRPFCHFLALPALLALLPLLGCVSDGFPQRDVSECPTLTPTELRNPIEGDALRIDDWVGDIPNFRMVVSAPLDSNGYVLRPRIESSSPAGIPSRQILETISTWRFCPEVARSLGGRPLRIPISATRQGVGRAANY